MTVYSAPSAKFCGALAEGRTSVVPSPSLSVVGTTRVRSAVSGIPTKRIVPVAPVAVITAPYSTPSTLIANSVMDANVWLTTLMR